MNKENQMLYEEDVDDDSEESNENDGEELEENDDENEIIDLDDEVEIPIDEEEKIKIEKLANNVENTLELKKENNLTEDINYKEELMEIRLTEDNQESRRNRENSPSSITKNLLNMDLNDDKSKEEAINILLLSDNKENLKKKNIHKSTFIPGHSRKQTSASKVNINSISQNNPELNLNYDFNSAISKVMKNMVRNHPEDENSDLVKQLLLGDQYFNEELKKVILVFN